MEVKDFCLNVAKVIEKDDVAVAQWNTVKDSLVTNPVNRLKISDLFKDKKYQEAIRQTIQFWYSAEMNRDWSQLVTIMRENDLAKLAGELESTLVQTRKPTGSIWFEMNEVPYNYTDRLTDMDTLHGLMLKSRDKHPGIGQLGAVTGLGGIGKSTLCTKYAYDHRHVYQNVIWIQSETLNSMKGSFQRFGTHVGIAGSQEMSIEDLVKAVYNYFSNKSCLFVFDNLEDLKVLESFRPKVNPSSVQPFVIITSRILDIVPVNMHLNTLTEAEASIFVLDGVKHSIQSDADELVQLLECLPLALQQAVAYMREKFVDFGSQTPIQKYISQFKTSAASMLNADEFRALNGYGMTTYTTWAVTFEHIKVKSETAVELLQMLSFLNPDLISVDFTKRLMEENTLEQSLMVLKKYSMITSESGMVKIHRLVQQVVKLGLSEDKTTQIVKSITEVVWDELKDYNMAYLARESVSHGLHVAKHQNMNLMPSWYLRNLCWYLYTYGNYADSIAISSRAAQHFTLLYGSNDVQTLRMKYKMGQAHFASENMTAALEIFEDIHQLAIANTEIGEDHRLTLAAQLSIADSYFKTDPEKSLKMLEELIPFMKTVLGDDDRHVILAVNSKGVAMMNLGKLDEALTNFEYVIEMEDSVGGPDKRFGLRTKLNIAELRYRKRDLELGLSMAKDVFQCYLSLLGETHSDTIRAQNLITQIETEVLAKETE